MTELSQIKTFIVSSDGYTCRMLEKEFFDIKSVEIAHCDVRRFFREHTEIDCLVSPANAFGKMTGGYDAALSDILGWDFQFKVQQYIREKFCGEQGVGTSFILQTDIPNVSLIHTPTMRYPSVIKDDEIIYYCTRSSLLCAMENNVKCVVLPVFGAGCGDVEPETAARRMKAGYEQLLNRSGALYDF